MAMSEIAASRPPCFLLAVDSLPRTRLVSELKCLPSMFMSQYHRVRYCPPVTGLILANMAFGAPASAAKLIASIKARGVAPPSRSVGMSFALPATSGFGSPKPWRAAFLIGFLEMDALEPVGALQIARQTGFMASRRPANA